MHPAPPNGNLLAPQLPPDFSAAHRPDEPIGYVPPAEYEASYYAQLRAPDTIEDGVAAGILQPAPTDDRSAWGIL